MNKIKFTEIQIIGILKQQLGRKVVSREMRQLVF